MAGAWNIQRKGKYMFKDMKFEAVELHRRWKNNM